MAEISFGFDNPLKARFGEQYFRDLPQGAGIYTFLDRSGQPLYIGKADNLKRRLMSYQAAKPGQAADHILEMIEHAHDLKLELHANSEAALRREEELIRSVRPRYNVALNYEVSYLYVGFRVLETVTSVSQMTRSKQRAKLEMRSLLDRKSNSSAHARVEFRLSHMDINEGFTSFGCFRHRGKAKGGYAALLRLLFAAHCPRERFLIPAKLCRSSPAYNYVLDLPEETLELLQDFLGGKNQDLLRYLVETLLSKQDLPKQLYIPLQRDLEAVKLFFKYGPQDTRRLARKFKSGNGKVAQEFLDTLISTEFHESLKPDLRRRQAPDARLRKTRPKTKSSEAKTK